MEISQKITAVLKQNTGQSTSISIKIKKVDKKNKWKKALKTFGLFCLLSIFFLPFPIIHFLLPPGIFFLGIFLAYKNYSKNIMILGTQIKCLACKKNISIEERLETYPLSMELTCPNCLNVSQLNAP